MDILIRKSGAIGHITLNRPNALNSLTYDMISAIEKALDSWFLDKEISLIAIDSVGEKAFCAGGDIQDLYHTGIKKNYSFGKKFWKDEYRLNKKIKNYPKPFISFIKGFAMGGGVGVSCHCSHRIVGETAKIAMPECGIGLIPDVGGSFILSRAGNGIGTFLGISGERMGPSDSIFSGFADFFIPEKKWPQLLNDLIENGDADVVKTFSQTNGPSKIENHLPEIEEFFSNVNHIQFEKRLNKSPNFKYLKEVISGNSPLSMASEIKIMEMPEVAESIENALEIEYRFTSRAMEFGDFLEGVRALVIDKDRNPKWKHRALENVSFEEVDFILNKI